MNNTQSDLERLRHEISMTIYTHLSPAEIEPLMAEFLRIVRDHPEEREFVVNMFKSVLEQPDAPWEFLAFCFHGLRWPEMFEFVQRARLADLDNIRGWGLWQNLIESFDDEWSDAEWYREFASR